MRIAALAALAALAACGTAGRGRRASLDSIQERENVADQKRLQNDPSAADEYRTAIGLAEAAAAPKAEVMRDAVLMLEAGPRTPGAVGWRMNLTEQVLRMTPEERGYAKHLISLMSASERESTVRWRSAGGMADSLAYEVSSAVADWRRLREAVARMRRNCGAACR